MEEKIYNTIENPDVSRVWFNSDAYLVCLTHALSTESEEIMGVCIGEINEAVSFNLKYKKFINQSSYRLLLTSYFSLILKVLFSKFYLEKVELYTPVNN